MIGVAPYILILLNVIIFGFITIRLMRHVVRLYNQDRDNQELIESLIMRHYELDLDIERLEKDIENLDNIVNKGEKC